MVKRLALVLVLAAATAGCGPQSSGKPVIAASFYPLAWIAQQVAGDRAKVVNLTSPGTEPHDLELTVSQTATVTNARVVFYEAGLQPSVDAAVENTTGKVAEVSAFVGLLPAARGKGTDPHVWLDPTQMSKIANGFTATLIAADPDGEETYRSGLAVLQRQLAQLDREWQRGLSTCTTRTVIVSHDAFEYLGRRYDLTIVPIAGVSPDAEPSAQQLAKVKQIAQDAKVTTIFTEPLVSSALADTLAKDLGVTTQVLTPIENEPGGEADYLSLMRGNLALLRTANGCS